MDDKPFRWNLSNRRALDSMFRTLAHADLPDQDRFYQPLFKMPHERIEVSGIGYGLSLAPEIIHTCARIAACASECDLVFVGRSPETLFDYLSGAFFETSWRERIILLQFSYRYVNKNRNWTLALKHAAQKNAGEKTAAARFPPRCANGFFDHATTCGAEAPSHSFCELCNSGASLDMPGSM